jgi:hypothetical protein
MPNLDETQKTELEAKATFYTWAPPPISRIYFTVLHYRMEFGSPKVKPSISVKISNCSYLETRFLLTKNTRRK